MKQLLIIVFCAIVGVLGWTWLNSPGEIQMGDLQIKDVALVRESGESKPKIVAKLVNAGEQEYRMVVVEFHVFNKTKRMIHNYIHAVSDIKAAEERVFDVQVVEEEARSVKIQKIIEVVPVE